MGARLQRLVAQTSDPDLSITLQSVLRTVADFADDETGERACPSRATIAQHVRCSVRTAQYALNRLRTLGWLRPVGYSRRYRTVLYRVAVERLHTNAPHLPGLLDEGRSQIEPVQSTAGMSAAGCTRSGHPSDRASEDQDQPALARRGSCAEENAEQTDADTRPPTPLCHRQGHPERGPSGGDRGVVCADQTATGAAAVHVPAAARHHGGHGSRRRDVDETPRPPSPGESAADGTPDAEVRRRIDCRRRVAAIWADVVQRLRMGQSPGSRERDGTGDNAPPTSESDHAAGGGLAPQLVT